MLLLLLAFTAFLIYYYLTLKFDYWKVRGIAFIKPIPFFGNFYDAMLLRKSMGDTLQDIYNSKDMKGQRYGGVFLGREPVLMIKHPDVINQVLVKDFEYFSDRGFDYFDDDHPMNDHLLVSKGERWRTLRKTFVQAFTSGRMSAMTDKLLGEADSILDSTNGNISEKFGIYSLKSMLLCVFGEHQIPANLISHLKQFLTPSYKNVIFHIYPKMLKIFGCTLFKQESINYYKSLLQTCSNKGNPWLQCCAEKGVNEDTVAVQLLTYLSTSLNAHGLIMAILRELSLAPAVLNKLDTEMSRLNQDKISDEDLKGMTYLNQVVLEALRKYSNGFLLRNCVKDNVLDGLKIEKGTKIIIPIQAVHYDPQYYPDPDVFDPDRFCSEKSTQSGTYLPFGTGPRKCPGFHISIMQIKVGLIKAWNDIPFDELKKVKWEDGRVGELGMTFIGGGEGGGGGGGGFGGRGFTKVQDI